MEFWIPILVIPLVWASTELVKAHRKIRRLTTQLDQAETTIMSLNAKLARIYMHGYSLGDDVMPEFPHRVDTPELPPPPPPPPASSNPNISLPHS